MAKFKHVPCGSCNLCCRNDAIFLKPNQGDDLNAYDWEYYQGKPILKHQANGDCIYLDRERGCTIHDRSPMVCQEFSCIDIAKKAKQHPFLKALFPEGVIDQGAKLRKRYGKYGLRR